MIMLERSYYPVGGLFSLIYYLNSAGRILVMEFCRLLELEIKCLDLRSWEMENWISCPLEFLIVCLNRGESPIKFVFVVSCEKSPINFVLIVLFS